MRNLVTRVLPLSARGAIRRAVAPVRILAMRLCAGNGVLASLYYLIFSRRFDREHLAVLRGRLAYHASLREPGRSSPLLRRNIHRLEKGLIMEPRRPLFGEGFIVETVRQFRRAAERESFSPSELKWATDVLDAYFGVVQSSPVVERARQVYVQARQAGPAEPADAVRQFTPYPRWQSPPCDTGYEELLTLFKRRRSVRWYRPIPVPGELIDKCVNAATLAPSACNRQSFRFIVANGMEQAGSVAACAGGTVGFAYQLPAVVIVVGDLSAYPMERDRHLIYIDASLASMQFMLAAETLGLATCPINWPDVDASEADLRRIVTLPPHERVVMLIAIGYADDGGGVPYSRKKEAASIAETLGEPCSSS